MRKKMWLASLLLGVGCGTKNHEQDSKPPTRKSPETSKEQQENAEAKYFKLMETCDISAGFAVIDDKCVPLRVSLTIDGKVGVGAVASTKDIFSGGIGLKPTYDFPFIKMQNSSNSSQSFTLKKSEKQSSKIGVNVETVLKQDEEISNWLMVSAFAGEYSKAQIELDIFGQKFPIQDQDTAKLEQTCKKIHALFKSIHPAANDATRYWYNVVGSKVQCIAANSTNLLDPELEKFKSLEFWWRCEEDKCYFESLSLN